MEVGPNQDRVKTMSGSCQDNIRTALRRSYDYISVQLEPR